LADICTENGLAVQSCGEDAVFDVFFTHQPVANYRDGLAADAQLMARFNAGLPERAILKGWPQKFYPSLAHTDADTERAIEACSEVIPRLRG
jgi:glutamate-1-semialdehyde aminotransferase